MPGCRTTVPHSTLRNHLNTTHPDDCVPLSITSWAKCTTCKKFGRTKADGSIRGHHCEDLSEMFSPMDEFVEGTPAHLQSPPLPPPSLDVEASVASAVEPNEEDEEILQQAEEELRERRGLLSATHLANAKSCLRSLHKEAHPAFQEYNRLRWANDAVKLGDSPTLEQIDDVVSRFSCVIVESCPKPYRRNNKKNAARDTQRRLQKAVDNIVAGIAPDHPRTRNLKARGSDVDPVSSRVRAGKAILAVARQNPLQANKKGLFSRVARALTREEFSAMSEDILAGMQKLHPPPLTDEELPALPASAPLLLEVDYQVLYRELKSMSTAANPGPDQWTAELAMALWADETCREGLAVLVRHISNGHVSSEARRTLLSSLLTALPKPAGGLRPVAMGEFLFKLVGRYLPW